MHLKKALEQAREEALNMLRQDLPPELTYHDIGHTQDVMQATERLASLEQVPESDIDLLLTAAAFHDTGYLYSRHEHEEKSCEIARGLLPKLGVDAEVIDSICQLILATRMPHEPQNRLEEILCDADLDYLGRDDYFTISNNVYQEFRHFGTVKNATEWHDLQLRFLERHRYYTPSSIALREKKKQENLRRIKEGNSLQPSPSQSR